MSKFCRKPEYISGQWQEVCCKHNIDPYHLLTAAGRPNPDTICFNEIPGIYWLVDSFYEIVDEVKLVPPTDMKFDGDKARVDLLLDGCPNAIEAVSQVLTFGAKKYADHSWQGVDRGTARYKAALLRHLLAHAAGESLDKESGLSHLAHAACNAMFILELELKNDA